MPKLYGSINNVAFMKQRLARVIFTLGTFCLVHSSVEAQDPQYSQFYANQVMLNPAFTGSGIGYRFALNYRAQWVGVPGYYKQSAFAFDMPMYIGRTTQGIGVSINRDVAGEGNLARTNFLLNYAFEIPLTDERDGGHTIRLGLSGGMQQASIDFYKLRFPDQIDPQDGFVRPSQDPILNTNASTFREDVNTGILYYNNYAFVSISAEHLTQPKQVFTDFAGPEAKLPMKYTVSGGMRIPLGDFRDPDKLSITPVFLAKMQGPFFQFDVGTYVNIQPMVFGFWYRHQDAVVALIGFTKGPFSLGYSYDYTVSTLTNSISQGSHELSLGLQFVKDPKKVKKWRSYPCPKF